MKKFKIGDRVKICAAMSDESEDARLNGTGTIVEISTRRGLATSPHWPNLVEVDNCEPYIGYLGINGIWYADSELSIIEESIQEEDL